VRLPVVDYAQPDAVADPIPVYLVLAWEPEPNTSFDDGPRVCSFPAATTGSEAIPDQSVRATFRVSCAIGATKRPP
jgi:hypothetical protein